MDEVELYEILTKSGNNNRYFGVTGLLTFRNGRFMQLLEGEETTVRDTYKRIRSDLRHVEVTTIADQSVEKQEFEEYKMCFEAKYERLFKDNQGYISRRDCLRVFRKRAIGKKVRDQLLSMIA